MHAVPIIENTARECELTDRLRAAIEEYPQASAVLVRRHGVYVWGKNWIEAKTQFECYDYLFEAAVKMRQLGMDAGRAPSGFGPANGHNSSEQRPCPALRQGSVLVIAFLHLRQHKHLLFRPSIALMRLHADGVHATKKPRLDGGPLSASNGSARLPTALVLDIEGTIAGISYVTDVLFPYAQQRLR